MNRPLVIRLVGILLTGLGLAMLVPGLLGLFEGATESSIAFGIAAAMTCGAGLLLYALGRWLHTDVVGPREAAGVVGFSWILAGFFGGLPLWLDGATSGPLDAVFESVSGLTTTGATILTNIEAISRPSMLWRSLTHWIGGVGIVVLFVAIFPQLGVTARHLLGSEGPGPITERLRPRLKQTALALWWIYAGLTSVLVVALLIAGMDLFEAVNHAMSTIATGGFSTRNASIGAFDSAAVEIIITVFMLLSGINFGLYHALFQGHVRAVLRDTELRVYLGIFFVVSCFLAGAILERHDGNVLTAFRYATFQTATIEATAGFGTDDFNAYPQAGRIILVLMMFAGGCAGSTAGGIKLSRVIVLLKAAGREIRRSLRPQQVRTLRLGQHWIQERTLRAITGFVVLYMVTYGVAVVLLSACGLDSDTSFSAVATCMAGVGPGLNLIGPSTTYAELPDMAKSVLIACMLLGRLELFTLVALMLPSSWRKR